MKLIEAIREGQNLVGLDVSVLPKLRRLAHKHHQQAENSCNGYGYVGGQVYYSGVIDDYARRTYGSNVKSAYAFFDKDQTIFDSEMENIEMTINIILAGLPHMTVEYQGDPRGNTVKVFYKGYYISFINQ